MLVIAVSAWPHKLERDLLEAPIFDHKLMKPIRHEVLEELLAQAALAIAR